MPYKVCVGNVGVYGYDDVRGGAGVLEVRLVRRGWTSLKDVAEDIVKRIGSSAKCARSVDVVLRVFDVLSFDYAEYFILEMGLSYAFYYMSCKPRFLWRSNQGFTARGSRVLYPLVTKSFSREVSGNIAETLFAYIAVNCCGVPRGHIIHLGPERSRSSGSGSQGSCYTPDFIVIDKNGISKLSWLIGGNGRCNRLFVECKGSVSEQIKNEGILGGLHQLVSVMRQGDCGLLFIVHRSSPQLNLAVSTVGLVHV